MSFFGDIGGFFKGDYDNDINHGFKVAADTVGSGIAYANSKLEDAYYHDLPTLKSESKTLDARYTMQRAALTADVATFHTRNSLYKKLVAYNASLVILLSILKMNDTQFERFRKKVIGETPTPSTNPNWPGGIATTVHSLSAGTGVILVLRGIKIVGKLLKLKYFSKPLAENGTNTVSTAEDVSTQAEADGVTDTAADTAAEVGAEAGTEVATDAAAAAGTEAVADNALAATGIGVVVAAGLTLASAAVEGSLEQKKLNNAISKLHEALDQLDGYISKVQDATTKIDQAILAEEGKLKDLAASLQAIQPYSIKTNYTVSVASLASYVSVAESLFNHYSYYADLRESWVSAQKRGTSWAAYESAQLAFLNNKISEKAAKKFLALLKTKSSNS